MNDPPPVTASDEAAVEYTFDDRLAFRRAKRRGEKLSPEAERAIEDQITIGKLEELQEREAAGETLSSDEQRALSRAGSRAALSLVNSRLGSFAASIAKPAKLSAAMAQIAKPNAGFVEKFKQQCADLERKQPVIATMHPSQQARLDHTSDEVAPSSRRPPAREVVV